MSSKILNVKESFAVLLAIIVIFAAGLLVGLNYGYIGYRLPFFSRNTPLSDVTRVFNLIKDNYDGKINEDKIVYETVQSMMLSLDDPYSRQISPDEYARIQSENEGYIEGIGINFNFLDKKAFVADVYPNSPAEQVGILPGDEILAVDGNKLTDLQIKTNAANVFKGMVGRNIYLEVASRGKIKKYTLERRKFYVPYTKYYKLNSAIGYLKIREFEKPLLSEFEKIVGKLKSDKVTKLIIDLRDNPGGNTDTALKLLDEFIVSGVYMSEIFAHDSREIVHRASGKSKLSDIKIVIIVDSKTASAAEIFTSAIQDNNRGKIIGDKTYGKNSIGNYFILDNGSAIHLTIGHWRRAKGNFGDFKGVIPDIVLKSKALVGDASIKEATKLFN